MIVLDEIHKRAVQSPERIALVHNGAATTYRQFHLQILAARRLLESWRLRPGAVAVLWVDRLHEAWVLNLALRSLGLATVAVLSGPGVEALGDLDIDAIVTLGSERGLDAAQTAAPGRDVKRIHLDFEAHRQMLAAGLAAGDLPPPLAASLPGGHILLTSGTTGVPKKVLLDPVTERSRLDANAAIYIAAGDAVREVVGGEVINLLSFGLWTAAGYTAPNGGWSRGDTMLFQQGGAPEDAFRYPGMTHAIVIPAFVQGLMNAPAGSFPYQPDLQLIVVGGAISMSLVAQVRERLTANVCSALGTTESGFWALTPIETDEDFRWHRIHPSRQLQVVDPDGRPLPPGQVGEVRVLINDDMTGYLGDEGTTDIQFHDGWFYPGDLGQFDDRGRLALMGRVAEMLNILGQKYPTGPIEEALQKRLGAEAVCVLSTHAETGGEELHVFIQSSKTITKDALTEAIQAELSGFPSAQVHATPALPRNHMGKVDRLKLREQLAR